MIYCQAVFVLQLSTLDADDCHYGHHSQDETEDDDRVGIIT